jgi:hypothetical protein
MREVVLRLFSQRGRGGYLAKTEDIQIAYILDPLKMEMRYVHE